MSNSESIPLLSEHPVVLANGIAAREHPDAGYLELAGVAGQLEVVRSAERPTVPLVGNGYLVAQGEDQLVVGATYEYRPTSEAQSRTVNLTRLGDLPHTWQASQRGVRGVSSDRTAVVGHIPSDGGEIYVSTGHGSMGTVSAPLAGAILASALSGTFAPVTRNLLTLMDPLRFKARQARRGVRHGVPPTD